MVCTQHDLFDGLVEAVSKNPGGTCLLGPRGTSRSWQELAADVRAWQCWLDRNTRTNSIVVARLNMSFGSLALMVAAITRAVRIAWLPLGLPEAREKNLISNLGVITAFIEDPSIIAPPTDYIQQTGCGHLVWNDDAKFVYFTSGSEGEPKAVQVGMDAVRNRIKWMWAEYPFEKSDKVVIHKPFSFVASFWEVLGTLLAGITGIVLTNSERARPDQFFDRLIDDEATHLFATPPTLLGLCEVASDQRAHLPQLRLVCSSADQLTSDVVAKLFAVAPSSRLINMYGTTETSANTTVFEVSRLGRIAGRVPLGEPIHNTHIVIRDERGLILDQGCEGRICVQGAPVADGYIVGGSLTTGNDAFFMMQDGLREIRTGDLGFIQDRVLTITGRIDNAVNVSGYKIHLEEIEMAACQLADSAGQCGAVYNKNDVDGYLALVIPYNWKPLVTVSRLSDILPPYMVPQRVVVTAIVPTLRTGKVDRRACLTLVEASEPVVDELVTKDCELREKVQLLWDSALGEKRHDDVKNFFAAGGDSLGAVRLLSSIRNKFGLRVPLRSFYADPTVSCLVDLLSPAEDERDE